MRKLDAIVVGEENQMKVVLTWVLKNAPNQPLIESYRQAAILFPNEVWEVKDDTIRSRKLCHQFMVREDQVEKIDDWLRGDLAMRYEQRRE